MGSYTQILYQVILNTKHREKVLTGDRNALYAYISGILEAQSCKCHIVGGVHNHLHILFRLHPDVALAKLVQTTKIATNKWLKSRPDFKNFQSWSVGYGAFTYAINAKENLIKYVANQEKHHNVKSFEEEYRDLLFENQIEIDEKYFLKD